MYELIGFTIWMVAGGGLALLVLSIPVFPLLGSFLRWASNEKLNKVFHFNDTRYYQDNSYYFFGIRYLYDKSETDLLAIFFGLGMIAGFMGLVAAIAFYAHNIGELPSGMDSSFFKVVGVVTVFGGGAFLVGLATRNMVKISDKIVALKVAIKSHINSKEAHND